MIRPFFQHFFAMHEQACNLFECKTTHREWCRFRFGLLGCNVSSFVLGVLNDRSQALPLLNYERPEEISAVRHRSSRYLETHPYTVVSPVYIFASDLRIFLDRSLG